MTGAAAERGAGAGARTWVLDSVTLAARIALGAVFVWASWFKIADPVEFAVNIATYQILPESLVNLMAITLPWLELGAGVLIVAGALARESAIAIGGMLVVFLAAILVAMGKHLEISCGCFASEDAASDIGWPKVIEDSAMLAAAAWIAARGGGILSVDALIERIRGKNGRLSTRPGQEGKQEGKEQGT